jgi:hypothetical protein
MKSFIIIIEKGKSGYYKCVNFHLESKYNGRNLSTSQAQSETRECLLSLKQCGFPITPSWMDQNCCYWSRKYGRNDGVDGRKKDVFFFNGHTQLFPPMWMKVFATGKVKAQLFILDSWYNLDEYWQPLYELPDLESKVRRRFEAKKGDTLSSWVSTGRWDCSLGSLCRTMCQLEGGTYSMF